MAAPGAASTRLTRYTHACVRLERDGRALVIDPGTWSEPEALEGASAVLVTHEHYDHIDAERLTAALLGDPDLAVYTNAAVTDQLSTVAAQVHAVAPGDTFTAAGFDVSVVGGRHAEIYAGLPGCPNVGFMIDERVFHPGDALFVPDAAVDTLLVPAGAPWLKLAEALDFVRAVQPRAAHPIHDAVLSPNGQALVDRWFDSHAGTDYRRLSPGESLDIGA